MATQSAQTTDPTTAPAAVPEWAAGLTPEQLSAVRLAALKGGKTPAELVREWVLELAAALAKPAA
jgi:hypothetical protein